MSSALKELFPTVKRRPRTLHVERGERTSASFLRVLSSKDKARGIAKRLPEAFVHFGSGTIKNYEHLRRAVSYIARNGNITLEKADKSLLAGKADYDSELYKWKLSQTIPDQGGSLSHARRLILSMPAGTPEDKFKNACRKWANDTLSGYELVLGFHTASTDQKTNQPHCHIIVSTIGKDGKRMHIDNQTRDAMREHFVACLKDFGIEATATRRWSRGKVLKGVPISEIHNERKFASSQERAKAHAIARKKERLRAKDKQIQSVISAFKEGRNIEDTPGITKIKKNREKLLQLVGKAIAELEQSGNSEDLKIAAGLKDYYKTLGPVESLSQRTLRELRETQRNNQKQADHIRRMQAMKKRKNGLER